MNRPLTADTLRAAEAGTVEAPATTFLREYFRGTQGPLYLTVLRNGKSKLQRGELAKLLTRKPGDINKFLVDHDKPEQECGIYYCTATLKDGSTRRKDTDCLQFPSLFADTDDKNHTLTRAQAIEAFEAMESPPTLIVDSGHGLQPHWLLSEPCEDAARIIAARKKLQRLVASDEVHDAPRVMRLPGSHNSKEGDWIAAQVVSQHPERRYTLEVLEEWLDSAPVAIPSKPKGKPKASGSGAAHGKPFIVPPAGSGTDHKRGHAWAHKALEASCEELANAGDGSRHNILRDKAVRMGTMVARGWVDVAEVQRALRAAAETCGLIKDKGIGEFEQTFADGIKHGMAMPHDDLPNDDPPHGGNGAAFEKPRGGQQHQSSESNSSGNAGAVETTGRALVAFPMLAFRDIHVDTTQRNYLIKNILPRRGLVIIWGPKKCYKSFIATDMALHVALDWKYRGHRVQQATVVYVALEGREGQGARKEAFSKYHSIQEAPFYLMTKPLNLIKQANALVASIKAQLGEVRPGAIFIDTLNRSLAGSESKDEDMAAYLNAAGAIEEEFKCLVVIVHHCGIDTSRPRGHTSLPGAVDSQLRVDRVDKLQATLTVELAKDFAEGAEIFCRLEPVIVGTDPDGDPITSLVVLSPEQSGSAPVNKGGKGLSENQKLALDALTECILERGVAPPIANGLPPSIKAVTLDQWKEQLFRCGVLERVESKNPRAAFNRFKTKLLARKAIGIIDELVWRA